MGSSRPPSWSAAARAAYFGDRTCAFCDRRNPAGATFCNGCASPLDLKLCTHCDAVNDQAAAACHNCGATLPVVLTPGAEPSFGAAEPSLDLPTSLQVIAARESVPATPPPAPQRTGAQPVMRDRVLVVGIATLLIIGALAALHMRAETPDVIASPAQAIPVADHVTPVAIPAVPAVEESTSPATARGVEDERVVPAATGNDASAPQVPDSVVPMSPPRRSTTRGSSPIPQHATARPRPEPPRTASVVSRPSRAHLTTSASARHRVPAFPAMKEQEPDRWRVMQVGLARCGGDLIARVVCDQRVRRRFCDGHWGKAPECTSRIANEHGQ